MRPANSNSSRPIEPFAEAAPRPISLALLLLLMLPLLAGALLPGLRALDAPWTATETASVLHDPAVAAIERKDEGWPVALRRAVTTTWAGTYQPLPRLSLALERQQAGGAALAFRRTNLLLHAVGGLLAWWVLAALIRAARPERPRAATVIGWCLALLWVVHPMFASLYGGADGRALLLGTVLLLLAWGLYLQSLQRELSGAWFAGSAVALLLAGLCQPVAGWALVALLLAAAQVGWRSASRRGTCWVAAILALLSLVPLRLPAAGAGPAPWLCDTANGAALWCESVPLLFENLVVPLDLRTAYLGTSYLSKYLSVEPNAAGIGPTIGFVLLAGGVALSVGLWLQRWRWTAAALLAWVALLGNNVLWAGQERLCDAVFYLPIVGLFGAVGLAAMRGVPSARPVPYLGGAAGLTVLMATGLLTVTPGRLLVTRGTVVAAQELAARFPHDPRTAAALAAAYRFAGTHPVAEHDRGALPANTPQRTLIISALPGSQPRHQHDATRFRTPALQGAYYAMLADLWLAVGRADQALAHAEAAVQLAPERFEAWYAQARALAQFDWPAEAASAFERAERRLMPGSPAQAAFFADYGCLLLFVLQRDAEGCAKIAMAFDAPQPTRAARLGMALCQIRYGQGAAGFELVRDVLDEEPTSTRAWLVVAEYHLRSHNWVQAGAAYHTIIENHPTHYAALRGFHETCLQVGQMPEAVAAWSAALSHEPKHRAFQAYRVWALALADDAGTVAAAEAVLAADATNPLACYARMLVALREGAHGAAVRWARRAARGKAIEHARGPERAWAALRLLRGRGALPASAVLAEAAVCLAKDFPRGPARETFLDLNAYLAGEPETGLGSLGTALRGELSDVLGVD